MKLGVAVAPGPEDAFKQWFPTFTRYVYNHEPTAAFAMTGDGDGNIYLQFWDSCDRRFAIAEAMAAYFHRRHGEGVRFTVSREVVDAARVNAGCGIQWLDCPR